MTQTFRRFKRYLTRLIRPMHCYISKSFYVHVCDLFCAFVVRQVPACHSPQHACIPKTSLCYEIKWIEVSTWITFCTSAVRHYMMLQAAPEKAGGSPSDHSKTLDINKFWAEATPYPKTPIEKWKRHFIVRLYAKTMIGFSEIRQFHYEPTRWTGTHEQSHYVANPCQILFLGT